jgi:hypothetical protein
MTERLVDHGKLYISDGAEYERDATSISSDLERIPLLEARIVELEESQRWIPVEERLPKDDTLVMVWIGCGIDVVFFRKGIFYTFAGSEVTHWRPMPNPPEVKG